MIDDFGAAILIALVLVAFFSFLWALFEKIQRMEMEDKLRNYRKENVKLKRDNKSLEFAIFQYQKINHFLETELKNLESVLDQENEELTVIGGGK